MKPRTGTHGRPRRQRRPSGTDPWQYLLAILAWEGITGERGLLADAVERWRTTSVAFVDAYLAALAAQEQRPIYFKNIPELRGQGVDVPDTLPATK